MLNWVCWPLSFKFNLFILTLALKNVTLHHYITTSAMVFRSSVNVMAFVASVMVQLNGRHTIALNYRKLSSTPYWHISSESTSLSAPVSLDVPEVVGYILLTLARRCCCSLRRVSPVNTRGIFDFLSNISLPFLSWFLLSQPAFNGGAVLINVQLQSQNCLMPN